MRNPFATPVYQMDSGVIAGLIIVDYDLGLIAVFKYTVKKTRGIFLL